MDTPGLLFGSGSAGLGSLAGALPGFDVDHGVYVRNSLSDGALDSISDRVCG